MSSIHFLNLDVHQWRVFNLLCKLGVISMSSAPVFDVDGMVMVTVVGIFR